MNDFVVIATVNDHLINRVILEEFAHNGVTMLRVNGSHVAPAEVPLYARKIRGCIGTRLKLLVDLPGSKVRTSLATPIGFRADEPFELEAGQFNYLGFVAQLQTGDVLLANDSLFKFVVDEARGDCVRIRSDVSGVLQTGKGVHLVGRPLDLPFVFARDRDLIRSAVESGFDYVGLSFVRTAEDIDEAAALAATFAALSPSPGILPAMMVKIETGPALDHLDAILRRGEEFIVDRGDLSCDVGLENVDRYQKLILRRGKQLGKRVYFATQFLYSMTDRNIPLIAEACGLADAIRCGVDGVQLSEETAIGKYPIHVLKTVQLMRSSARPRLRFPNQPVPILWLTGDRGSGKTTLAGKAAAVLESRGFRCCVIDDADYRLAFPEPDGLHRELQSYIFAASLAARSFDLVIVAAGFGARADRDRARGALAAFHEIHLNRPRSADAGAGGTEETYEAPLHPELLLETGVANADVTLASLEAYLFGP